MHYRILEGGAIACSAVAIWGWMSAPNLNSNQPCESPQSPEMGSQSAVPRCMQENRVVKATVLPEGLVDLVWGGHRAYRVAGELEAVYEKVLVDSQALAKRDRLPEALSHLGGIPKNSHHYSLMKQLQDDWSQELRQQALQSYQQANIKAAQKLLNSIPPSYSQFAEIKKLAQQWSREAQWLHQAQQARNAGSWNQAIQALKKLENSALYRSRVIQDLVQEAANHASESNNTLLQAALNTERITSVTPGNQPYANYAPPLPVEPITPSTRLEITAETALTWAQPPQSSGKGEKPQAQPEVNSPSSPHSDSSSTKRLFPHKPPQSTAIKHDARTATPSATHPAIAPPESLPISPPVK